jgi:hypothetical protein
MQGHTARHSPDRDSSRGAQRSPARHAAATLATFALITLAACSDSVGIGDNNVELEYDFSTGYQGWVAGFSDYPVGKEAEWGINSSLAALPLPLDITRRGILLTGVNHSDDLFMYMTRGLADLAPNGRYAVRFRVTMATNAPKNCAGIGGAPGESVVLKVGATPAAPQRTVDAGQHYRTNFDHGSQLSGGRDASPVGDLATSNTNCLVPRYELKEFDSGSTPLTFTADGSGRLWLIVGVDSGFEGTTAAYITSVRVEIQPR